MLKTIKSRGITELELRTNYHIVESNIDLILQCLPHLEGLSFCSITLITDLQIFAEVCFEWPFGQVKEAFLWICF